MKDKSKNMGISPKDLKRGFTDGTYKPDKFQLDEDPPNRVLVEEENDGGFAGRPKGLER